MTTYFYYTDKFDKICREMTSVFLFLLGMSKSIIYPQIIIVNL